MKKSLLILLTSFFTTLALAQNFPYGQMDTQTLEMKKYAKDTSAHAVVLQEYGTSKIESNNENDLILTYQYHVKIKIFDNKGLDKGTVEIKIHNDESNNKAEEVNDLTATTYYLDDSGFIQMVTLDPKKVYTVRDYKYQSTMKFAMPALRNGCVIEYKYTLVLPFFLDHFRAWEFQSDIPKIYSEYEAHIPGHFTYNAMLRGPLKLTKNNAEIEKDCFSVEGAKSDCSDLTYGMSDVPAFVEEDYMTAPKNFRAAMEFELVEWVNPYTGSKTKVTKEWRDIDYQLKTEQEFGGQLKKRDFMKEHIAPALTGKNTDLEKAKAIYAYLQKWFKWNEYVGIYSNDGIKKAYESHSGSIADINLALVAALNSAGINTEAVLLSTREHGTVSNLYPALGDFNYVIAKANIGDKSYFLDATDLLLPFGVLPLKCLNDRGRAISLDKPSYWTDLVTNQHQTTTTSLELTLQDDGKLKGTMTVFSSGYSGYLKRTEIKKFNSTDEYVENLNEKLIKFKIIKSEISYLDSLDLPIEEKYDVEINATDNQHHDRFLLNPFILNQRTVNPFKLTERTYPVDWGMPSEDRYILTLHLPEKYTIENPPQSAAFAMPNQGGRFLIDFQNDNNLFVLSHITKFNQSIYSADEYPYLKELYNKIILAEKTELILKKN